MRLGAMVFSSRSAARGRAMPRLRRDQDRRRRINTAPGIQAIGLRSKQKRQQQMKTTNG